MTDEVRRPWDKINGETEKAYSAFTLFIELPKRGSRTANGKPRRFLTDLAQKIHKTPGSIQKWATAWDWEARAQAYDEFICPSGVETAVDEDRKAFAVEIRSTAKSLREIATQAIEEAAKEAASTRSTQALIEAARNVVAMRGKLDQGIALDSLQDALGQYEADGKAHKFSLEEALRFLKMGVDLEEKAAKIVAPEIEGRRENLVSDIRDLVRSLTAKLGGPSGGSPGGIALPASGSSSERLPTSGRRRRVSAVPAVS